MKVLSRTRIDLVFGVAAIASVIAAISVWWTQEASPRFDGLTYVLLVLALIGELLPVEVIRKRATIAFSLPFIAGISLLNGPGIAIVAGLVLQLIVDVGHLRRRHRQIPLVTLSWNLAVGCLSTSLGATLASLVLLPASAKMWTGSIYIVLFGVGYIAGSFILYTIHDSRLFRLRLSDNLVSSIRLGAFWFVLYALIGAMLGFCVSEGAILPVVLSLIPILALRLGLEVKSESYRHYYETITTLTLMLQRVHPYTHGHLIRVATFAEEVALRLGFSYSHAHLVREASVMHDLGKIAIDESILDKPTKLAQSEMEHIRQHAGYGAEILSKVARFQPIVNWVRSHHERPDGTGYPDRLLDVEIPIESKIIAVADAFDAMTAWEPDGGTRSYRKPITTSEALSELERCSGTQFDPTIVQVFKAVVLGYD